MTSASLMYERGNSKLVLWDNPDGWGEERTGREFQDSRDTCTPMADHINIWQKPPQDYEVISLQLN